MKESSLLRVFCVVVACVALTCAPKSVFAQRGGGHGGGGGSHGGGGGSHSSVGGFHSGGGASGGHYGGYYGHGYYGGHGGYYGHGGYWGHSGHSHYGYGYGYGWGFGLAFGWGWPYWYPYGYGYSPWWYGPNYYPYYAPYGYSYPYNGGDPPPPAAGSKSHDNAPVKPQGAPAPQSAPNMSARSANFAASHTPEQLPPARREVQDAIRVAREMPPYAFQRRIDSGRYKDFTREERMLVNNVAQFQLAWEKP
jgi:hypothetical protein